MTSFIAFRLLFDNLDQEGNITYAFEDLHNRENPRSRYSHIPSVLDLPDDFLFSQGITKKKFAMLP